MKNLIKSLGYWVIVFVCLILCFKEMINNKLCEK